MTVTPPVVPIVKSSITLTCTVELSSLVDVPVTVTTEWSGPDGFTTTNTAQPVIRSPTATYASTATVSSSDSEIEQLTRNYTCKATVRAMMSSFLIDSVGYSSSRVIVGKAINFDDLAENDYTTCTYIYVLLKFLNLS